MSFRYVEWYEYPTCYSRGKLVLRGGVLHNSVERVYRITEKGHVGTKFPISKKNNLRLKEDCVVGNDDILRYGSKFFCCYRTLEDVSDDYMKELERSGAAIEVKPEDDHNTRKRIKKLIHCIDNGEYPVAEEIWNGEIPYQINGEYIEYRTRFGDLELNGGNVLYGSFALDPKVTLTICGSQLCVLDKRTSTPDFWEYTSDGRNYMPGPPCCSESSRHKLGDEKVKKYIDRLREKNTVPTSIFCDWADHLWRMDLASRKWREE